jgi:hypothetical protein
VALKVRVLATPSLRPGNPQPATVYHAEAHDEHDPFREQRWQCSHAHESSQLAHQCGLAWLKDHGSEDEAAEPEPTA